MRHRKQNKKLGRSSAHRRALLSSLVCNLIDKKRITTTLAKAKLSTRLAEKMVTLGRQGTLAARRNIISELMQEKHVTKLLSDIVPQFADRHGGYTRVLKLGRRMSDGSEMAVVEWVGIKVPERKKRKKPAKAEAADQAATAKK